MESAHERYTMKELEQKLLSEVLRRLADMEITGVSIDSRNIREGELFVALRGDRFDGHEFVSDALKKGAWGALVERSLLEAGCGNLGGLRNVLPVKDTLLALQEMAADHRRKFAIPCIGITGSNGKTTTKEMTASIMRQKGPVLKNEGNLNNHIGVPLTLLKLNAAHRSAVVEMGMSAAGEIDLLARLTAPGVAVITNIGPAHLEFLGSLEKIAEAKAELLANLEPGGTAVLNADDRFFPLLRSRFPGKILSFGIEQKADVVAYDINQADDFTDLKIGFEGVTMAVRLRTLGRHNISNALAAAAAAIAAGMTIEAVKSGLEAFLPFAMRSEIKVVQGRTVLADCYNANPGSMRAALETLVTLRPGRNTVAVLGDMLELGESGPEQHREIGRIAARVGTGSIIALGVLAQHILEGAAEAGMSSSRLFSATSHAAAATMLRSASMNGDAVLVKGSRGMKMEKILEEF